jgi:predicted RNA-binding protein with PIN domain
VTTEPAEPDGTGDVSLIEPARLQVIALAADVLGKLAADEVPAPLRPFARFAPAKRARLGAVAIGAALDRDEKFRDRVAQTVIDTSPELVAALREGSPPAAADPLDVIAVAYLTRPDGWPELVRRATDRWTAEQQSTGGNSEELARLRAEVGELRSRLRAERARVKQAVTEALEEATAELGELRRTLRERTRDLRAAEQDRAAARADAAAARDELAQAQSAHEVELRRLRARLTDAERGAEAARRESRADRDLDTARLWLLVDTLVQAASGVRRELSLPAPTLRPADTFGSAGESAPGRRQVSDPAGLDQLLAMPNVHLIVDGYNVTKAGYGELALAAQRDRLLTGLAALHAQTGAEITVAFDGGTKPPAQPPVPRGLRVLFSEGEIADDLIRRLVAAEPSGRPVVVVSSDGEVVRDTSRDGAWTAPSAVLLARLG